MSAVALDGLCPEVPGPSSAGILGSANTAGGREVLARVLERLGIPERDVREADARATACGSEIEDELALRGLLDADDLARSISQELNLPLGAPTSRDRMIDPDEETDARILRTCSFSLEARIFCAPPLASLDRFARWLATNSHPGIVIASAKSLRDHRAASNMDRRLQAARSALASERPDWSARTVMTAYQGCIAGIVACAMVLAATLLGTTLWIVLHAIASLFFCGWTLFRFRVLLAQEEDRRLLEAERMGRESRLVLPIGRLPVYTVLVAVYREEDMIAPLVDALARLSWPAARLDVKIICEADDTPTLAAVRDRIDGMTGFELVEVPPSEPRTKPKALNYALPLARGEFVVLYDAEDRPDPEQLLEAYLAFRAAGPDLACLQAPLVIRNAARNWLTALFALEYAVLFRAVLPFLARRRLPIPLGGTSNHFRRSVLRSVGAWDCHNVAEDADLGIRLARFGYRTDIITAPTSEIAPERWRDWHKQRSRWVKGWIQTYLVHMRRPGATLRELGLRRMLAFQLLFFSMVSGAAMHTIFVGYLVTLLIGLVVTGRMDLGGPTWLLAIDAFNIAAAALVFAGLVSAVATREERQLSGRITLLWLYWLLVSLASVRSVVQLLHAPHLWEKTPHHEGGTQKLR